MKVRHLVERPGVGRLGRHVEHDPRSKSFRATAGGQLVTASWQRHCDPYDQGSLGSCTGNAMAGAAMTGPLFKTGRHLLERDAVRLYEAATRLDNVPGFYPPDDTGSSGLAVAKAAQKAGLIKSYHHAFGLQEALVALGRGPVIIGIDWYDGFDAPVGTAAELIIAGQPRGGHEVCLTAVDVAHKVVRGCNSWGKTWGDHGYFTMSFDTFGKLLATDGDVVVPLA